MSGITLYYASVRLGLTQRGTARGAVGEAQYTARRDDDHVSRCTEMGQSESLLGRLHTSAYEQSVFVELHEQPLIF